MHHEHLSPKFSLLITDPLNRIIILSVLALGYFSYQGLHSFVSDITTYAPPFVKDMIIDGIFGSTETLFMFIKFSFKFAIVAHVMEAMYVAFLCRTVLKLKTKTIVEWYLIVSITGYPMTSKVLDFVNVHKETKMKKN